MTKPTGKPKGRPKGSKTLKVGASNTQILQEYKSRLLRSPSSEGVIKAIFHAALDDEHKHQAVAWKIISDRILPLGSFDKDAGANTRSSIQVNISTVAAPATEVAIEGTSEVIDEG